MNNHVGPNGRPLHGAANLAWKLFQAVNTRLPQGASGTPSWAPAPLMKSHELDYPRLGFPRETDSLCPECVFETRAEILAGRITLEDLDRGHYAEIKSEILEENGMIAVRKDCPRHGRFEDILSIDPEFSRLQEQRFFGRDFPAAEDEPIHRHGSSNIKYGRGSVLNIDLTNRCNMMCHPCFANANQAGFVHELSLEEIKKILDDSLTFKPRRVAQVQFSGGEPTISPHFLEACRYARDVGYTGIQAATNGIRFALESDFAYRAREAGLNLVYFQLDGVTNEANKHRHIPNLFDIKLQAMENLAAADIWITPVTTVVNGLNTDQVGPLMQFIIDNCDKMDAISFQPISFTGRDEEITDAQRHAQRYTTSHLAWELQRWSRGEIDPHRDWYPLGAGAPLTMLADHVSDPTDRLGGMCVSCHPDCGSCVYIVANKKTKVWAPITKFFNLEQFIRDVMVITDSARGKRATMAQLALSLGRNFDQSQSLEGFDFKELVRLIQHQFHGSITDGQRPPQKDWTLIWAGGMWFQDLWTYDFRRTEMCCVPYGTQEGEISFCAYNTGIGYRQIIEHRHQNARTADWYRQKGRHRIYSGNRTIPLNVHAPSIQVPAVKRGGYCAMCTQKRVTSSGLPEERPPVAPARRKKEASTAGA
jgi:uncharacterized radical SAM superfamily Fe-S cluster-containing enzyme